MADPFLLVLTPVKNAVRFLADYLGALQGLDYPADRMSLGFLESDSDDGTADVLSSVLPALGRRYRRARLWKKDFGYVIPPGVPRYADEVQLERRTVLARSRNHLLMHALDDEAWVLWLDVDVVEYPADIVRVMLATGHDVVHPNCVLDPGGPAFDRNAWRDHGRLHLDDLRTEGDLVPLDSVGGTMLLVNADRHRDGLIFPPFRYGLANSRVRTEGNLWQGEIETEGFGIMALDMGVQCWGMPRVETRHRKEL